MNFPCEMTLKALLGDDETLARIRHGELVARVRGDVRPIQTVSASRFRGYVVVEFKDDDARYGQLKRVVVSKE